MKLIIIIFLFNGIDVNNIIFYVEEKIYKVNFVRWNIIRIEGFKMIIY